jgi:GGDEF domain-containing protein
MRRDDWAILYVGILDIEGFNEAYGFVAGDDVLRFAAMVLNEGVERMGTASDFVGHVNADDFVVVTDQAHASGVKDFVAKRFEGGVGTFYSFRDRERGYVLLEDPSGDERRVPLMTLAVGTVTSDVAQFADIREITEIAAAERRKAVEARTPQG